ncbi:MAG: hypothetical protein H7Z19_05720 [Chitinophagaceae bacterium]|nr:hypothetical protein [Rubrivivax sp.]
MTGWFRPALIVGVVMLLITANVIEFRAKRRADADALAALDGGEPRERLLVKQYRQTQNIEQLLHVISTLLFSILVALLWV